MPLNTISIATHIAPVVLRTLWRNLRGKASRLRSSGQSENVKDDVLFEEAYNIVKKFLEISTHHSVESLQTYTNTHVPSPPWSVVAPVLIPLHSCDEAARKLIEWFDPVELSRVVGGERWWQVRGLDGLDAEWVTEKKFVLPVDIETERSVRDRTGLERDLSGDESEILGIEHLEKVMLYIHGGGYFFGSINTHRYQILRYARKMRGRAFTVNYRKAPQYPWPCALQDVLAAYLFLINPPRTAVHSPVDPRRLVLAGDSAGGGLCLTALTIIRDLGLPMPAGAILISPWVDLTHSFPSVMENVKKDIIPDCGFVYRPSVIWPVEVLPEDGRRVAPTETYPPPRPGHADTLQPTKERIYAESVSEATVHGSVSQSEMLEASPREPANQPSPANNTDKRDLEHGWSPKPPKVLMEDWSATPLELRSQIQLYATNEQLVHPLVSPILQGSLGNLPPLFIVAGDEEALRDEIIYLAHRAANPESYKPRDSVFVESKRQRENAARFKTPTKVHLQVYDGMSHVLTVYTFHESVKYAYRAIAKFVHEVTSNEFDTSWRHGSLPSSSSSSSSSSSGSRVEISAAYAKRSGATTTGGFPKFASKVPGLSSFVTESPPSSNSIQPDRNRQRSEPVDAGQIESALANRQTTHDHPSMIRQRIDSRGRPRPMEPEDSIDYLRMSVNKVCLLKEAPVRRWLAQQQEWDKRFEGIAKRVMHRRKKYERKYNIAILRAVELGIVVVNEDGTGVSSKLTDVGSVDFVAGSKSNAERWGPLDLENEHPPPSAIAGRRDNPDSLALLTSAINRHVPKRIAGKHRRKPQPRQSTSEQQHYVHVLPMHGLRIWSVLMSYFGHKTSGADRRGKRRIKCSRRQNNKLIDSDANGHLE